jgi:hypothetical protein
VHDRSCLEHWPVPHTFPYWFTCPWPLYIVLSSATLLLPW